VSSFPFGRLGELQQVIGTQIQLFGNSVDIGTIAGHCGQMF
jgi:hypothetical protein